MLDLRHAVHRVVIGLAHDRAADAHLVADAADFGDAPGAMVGDAEMPDFSGADEIGDGADRLVERRRVILFMQVVNVDESVPRRLRLKSAPRRAICATAPAFRPWPIGLPTLVASTQRSRSAEWRGR